MRSTPSDMVMPLNVDVKAPQRNSTAKSLLLDATKTAANTRVLVRVKADLVLNSTNTGTVEKGIKPTY